MRDVAVSASVNAIIGIGLTFVIITAGIDLAVGAMASFVGIVSATLMVNSGLPPAGGLLLGLAVGVLCGAVNGLLITKLSLPPFIATLGTMSVFQGGAYVATNGKPVYDVPQQFVLMLNSYVAGVPVVVVVVAVVGVAAWLLLRKTVFGQNVIAVGGSEETAWLSGVRVHRVKIAVYCISGGLSALGGLVIVARINAAQPDAGAPYQLTAIAAAVIGGANLMGGEGRIAGTLVGALILGALTNGLVLLNVPSFYEQIVTGSVVLIAVSLDQGSRGWPLLAKLRSRSTPGGGSTPAAPAQAPSVNA
nr:ABC transporter permease [Quadrisphaera sp. RL12-1S]